MNFLNKLFKYKENFYVNGLTKDLISLYISNYKKQSNYFGKRGSSFSLYLYGGRSLHKRAERFFKGVGNEGAK